MYIKYVKTKGTHYTEEWKRKLLPLQIKIIFQEANSAHTTLLNPESGNNDVNPLGIKLVSSHTDVCALANCATLVSLNVHKYE